MSSWVLGALGGAMIGLSATLLLLGNGRIAGISGIFAGLLVPKAGDMAWRAWFVGGLLLAGLLASAVAPETLGAPEGRSLIQVGAAGLLVGFGVRLGSGCTSGHGVCGLARFSQRSLIAVLTFVTAGIVAATVARIAGGLA